MNSVECAEDATNPIIIIIDQVQSDVFEIFTCSYTPLKVPASLKP